MTTDLLIQQAQEAHGAGDAAGAERILREVLQTEPQHPRANRLLGIILLERGEPAAARDCFARSIAVDPGQPGYYQNMAMALAALGDDAGSLTACEQAIRLKPDYALAWFNRGECLTMLSRFAEGIESHKRAISLGLRDGRPYCGMGIGYYLLDRVDEARACFERAKLLSPDIQGINAKILFCVMRLCDWHALPALSRAVMEDVEQRNIQLEPFMYLALPTTPAQQRHCAGIFSNAVCPPRQPLTLKEPRREGPLRIAYVSKDFCNHPVTYLIAETLKQHDREAFEIFAVSYGQDKKDAGRTQIMAAADHFIDVRTLTDRQAAEAIQALDIDIAVDLTGHTRDARPGILSHRPARLQVNYLGYAGTMAAPHMDYLIGDAIITPPEHQPFYSEQLVRLPVCYLPPGARPKPRDGMTRAACGLPEKGFVFCAFNNSYKIRPEIFSIWMRLLHQVPGGVLWLREDNRLIANNLMREAKTAGVDPARLIFSAYADARNHFARLALADLFLDTAPYNAHTTAADALSVGLPVLTAKGEAFAGRVAASLLTQAGLTDLIAASLEEYEKIALRFVTDPDFRTRLAATLAERRPAMFDAAAFTRHLESAYRAMAERHARGQKSEAFDI